MHKILLESKIQIPARAHKLVQRTRLKNVLEQQISYYRLVLLSAPASYGKTTLLADWAHASELPVAWLTADREDARTEEFLRYMLASWERAQPERISPTLQVLLESQKPDIQNMLVASINAAYRMPDPLCFVIDDYQLIANEEINQVIDQIVSNLPGNFHFLLACRSDPALPLARYRARGQLLELGIDELAFSPAETAQFFRQSMGLDLPASESDSLHARTEGWITGLQLTGLAIQRGRTSNIALTSGRQRYIADYLRQDVFDQLPDDKQDFLLKTSILDRMCAALCEATSGVKNGQRILENLERENLFTIPIDGQREWFRYHSLFHEFLRSELTKRLVSEIDELHRRAACWYLEQNLPEQAFQHALEAQDADLVIKILERHLEAKLMGGEFNLLERWLASIPQAWQSKYSMIGFSRTGLLLFTGQLDACIHCIDEIEERLASENKDLIRQQLARVSAVRCSIACFQNNLQNAETFASQAFKDLPVEDHLFQSILYGSLGDTYRRNGHWEQARQCYQQMLAYIHDPGYRLQSAHVYGALADLDLRQGHLKKAAKFWRKAVEVIQESDNRGRFPLPLTGWVYIRLAEVLYEWNDLDEAQSLWVKGLERAEMGEDVRARIAGYLIAGRMKLTASGVEPAQVYLERARPLVEGTQFPHWASRFERLQLEIWLAKENMQSALDWFGKRTQKDMAKIQTDSVTLQLSLERVLIFRGDRMSLKQALDLAEQTSQEAEIEGRMGIQIEALALRSLAHWEAGNLTQSMTCLESALRLAEPEGYVRLFADIGLPMGRLLQEAQSREVMSDYVEKLLEAFGSGMLSPISRKMKLPEPLTPREEEIIALLAAGLTNQEIANELVISSETVKKHASSIYGKLGVSSRTEAAARARELHLLD